MVLIYFREPFRSLLLHTTLTFSLTSDWKLLCVDVFHSRWRVKTIFTLLAEEIERDIPYAPEPIGRFNVAPGTKALLLSEREKKLHLDSVLWGYAPGWWDKPPLINARVETAATPPLW